MDTRFTDDLPEELKKQLVSEERRGSKAQVITENYLKLLKDSGEPLSLNQLLIGYWRRHGEIQQRKQARTRLSSLVQTGKAKRHGNGIYSAL